MGEFRSSGDIAGGGLSTHNKRTGPPPRQGNKCLLVSRGPPEAKTPMQNRGETTEFMRFIMYIDPQIQSMEEENVHIQRSVHV